MESSGLSAEQSRRFWWCRKPSLLWCLVLFAAVGVVQTLCFDQQPSLWLGWIAWVPLAWLALEDRWPLGHRLLMGWCCGSTFWLINASWLVHTIGEHGGLPQVVAWGLVGLLAVYLGLYSAALVAVGALVSGRRPKGRVASEGGLSSRPVVGYLLRTTVLAAAWVLLEIVREWMITGFPWSPAGESLVRIPGALDASAWIGVRGLSFVVLWINVMIAQFVRAWFCRFQAGSSQGDGAGGGEISPSRSSLEVAQQMRVASWAFGISTSLVAVGLFSASLHGRLLQDRALQDVGVQTVEALPMRIVQPNVPIGASPEEATRNYHRLLRLSQCGPEAELIIWPESAAFPWSWERSLGLQRDVTRALDGRCSLLFNSSLRKESDNGEVGDSNTALLATPSTETDAATGVSYEGMTGDLAMQRYDKIHLVPYGEYVPLKEVLPFVRQLARGVGEFQRGTEVKLLYWRDAAIGVSICFEVLFPKEVAERVRMGATALITMTNDAWFADTRGPRQHLVSARFRAAESRLPMLFVTTTGVSASIDRRGRVLQRVPWGVAEALTLDLHQDLGHSAETDMTFYSRRLGAIDLGVLLLFSVALILVRR